MKKWKKPMKRLWNKFRKWLIKKLGGYELRDIPVPVMTVQQRNIVPIRADAIIHEEEFALVMDTSFLTERVKRDIARRILNEVYEGGYIQFEFNRDPLRMEQTLQGTLVVCDRR